MLEVIGLENKDKWAGIISKFRDCDVYYLPGYTKAFHIHGDGEPLLFYYESKDMKAASVAMKRDIAEVEYFSRDLEKDTWFDIATPYGYGGFLIEGEKDDKALKKLDEEYTSYCASRGIVSEIVRFHPLLKNQFGMESVYEIAELGRTVSVDLSSPEVIDSNIETKALRQIRKAGENGIKILSGNTWDLYSEFQKLYEETMDRNEAAGYYYFNRDFYKSVMIDLKENSVIFYAALGSEIIAMSLVLLCNKKMHSHLQCSSEKYKKISPTTLLRYEIALWGSRNGYETFHLGGGVGSQEDSLYRFKKKFNKNSDNRFAIGKKVFDREKYSFLLELRKKASAYETKPGFFPEYRS